MFDVEAPPSAGQLSAADVQAIGISEELDTAWAKLVAADGKAEKKKRWRAEEVVCTDRTKAQVVKSSGSGSGDSRTSGRTSHRTRFLDVITSILPATATHHDKVEDLRQFLTLSTRFRRPDQERFGRKPASLPSVHEGPQVCLRHGRLHIAAAVTLQVILQHLVACQWAKSEIRLADAAIYGQVPDYCPAFQCNFEVDDRQELVAHWEAEHLESLKCQHTSEQGDKRCSASHSRRSDMLSQLTSVHRLNLWESPEYKMCTSCELMVVDHAGDGILVEDHFKQHLDAMFGLSDAEMDRCAALPAEPVQAVTTPTPN